MVDQLDFDGMKVNTANFIHEARIKGNVGKLSVQAHGIDLANEHVLVENALLADAKLAVELSDTVPADTAPSENFWKINLQKLKLKTLILRCICWGYSSGKCLFWKCVSSRNVS